jgi:hypothetical protein
LNEREGDDEREIVREGRREGDINGYLYIPRPRRSTFVLKY